MENVTNNEPIPIYEPISYIMLVWCEFIESLIIFVYYNCATSFSTMVTNFSLLIRKVFVT